MLSEVRELIHANVAHLTTPGMDAVHVADAAVITWRDIDTALSPIIGQRGVAALYKRSLYLTRGRHACIASVYESEIAPGDFVALQSALSQQTGTIAIAAHGALLQAFCDLLATLIGASLTEQLLRSVWNNHSRGGTAQDTRQ